ncbi:hypothetical protein RD792_014718 [Penstemon davidsonii]|uniref:Thioredoxin domain-containing protein n=1 Tax=Penstemon davidsonii TaxID=160366 RepID=A0ABR0CQT5_9LAMI|nr:hypothetical protein RD792_014718 [Penstemon davidsonii]
MSRENISDEIIIESDIELDESDVVAPDNGPFEEMGYPSVEVSEENQEAAEVLKSDALNAICEDQLVEAKDHLTRAIMLNPKSALLFASRAICFVKLKKPNAAIRDADAALQMNPHLARGYKARGMARAMLGLWEEAAIDLNVASKLDFDEETYMMLKKVEPNANKTKDHRQKYEQLHRENELRKLELERQSIQRVAEATRVLPDGQVIEINDGMDLQAKLSAANTTSRLAIIYFKATWCGACCYMDQIYKTFAEKYPKILFLTVDIHELPNIARGWSITSIPTFFFFKEGNVVDWVTSTDKHELEMKILHNVVS